MLFTLNKNWVILHHLGCNNDACNMGAGAWHFSRLTGLMFRHCVKTFLQRFCAQICHPLWRGLLPEGDTFVLNKNFKKSGYELFISWQKPLISIFYVYIPQSIGAFSFYARFFNPNNWLPLQSNMSRLYLLKRYNKTIAKNANGPI